MKASGEGSLYRGLNLGYNQRETNLIFETLEGHAMRRATRHDDLALIGRTSDDEKVYLERGAYECDWYYGFGYLEFIPHNGQKIARHTHWSSLFTDSSHVQPEDVENVFTDHIFTDGELWTMCDLMKTFYSLKETSGIYNRGNSHLTSPDGFNLSDDNMKERIDKDTEKVIREVQKLVGLNEPHTIDNEKYPHVIHA